MSNDTQFKSICLGGGGFLGFSYITVIKEIEDNYIINWKKLKCLCGTSAGGLFAFLLNMGLSSDHLFNFFKSWNYYSMIRGKWMNLAKYGYSSTRKIKEKLDEIIERKFGLKKIDFNTLYYFTQQKLIIVVTDLNTEKPIYLSKDTHPNQDVVEAVIASLCIPGLLIPIEHKETGHFWVDGALTDSFPILNKNLEKYRPTLGVWFNISERLRPPIKKYTEYIGALYSTKVNFESKRIIEHLNSKLKENCIFIDTPPEITSLNMSQEDKAKYILNKSGTKAKQKFLVN